jgi:hypothetical protein
MELWEKVFIGVTLGLVLAIVIANAAYLCLGKARQKWSTRNGSSKNPLGNDESEKEFIQVVVGTRADENIHGPQAKGIP